MSAELSTLQTRVRPEKHGLASPPAHPLEVADLLVAYLEQLGIEYVFGIPGGAIEPLYNAMARSSRRGGLRHILARHESGAAFMADGYARETGRVGVCCSTSGPGATNLLTGVACAYDNNIPLLVITGQPALPSFGRHPLQESGCTGINILSMFEPITRYNSLVSHPRQLEPKLISALLSATRAPRGPVHLSFPADVFRSSSTLTTPSYDLSRLLIPSSLVDDTAIETLQGMLVGARKLVLVIGDGCREAMEPILEFAALTGARLVTTPDGKGLVSPGHPQLCGVFGFGGHTLAGTTLRDETVDLILAIGVGMGEWNSDGWSRSLLNERLVHMDESEEHLAHTPMARLHVRGRILTVFNRLVSSMQAQGQSEARAPHRIPLKPPGSPGTAPISPSSRPPRKYESDAIPLKPQRLMNELARRFPPKTRFLADTGNSVSWAVHCLCPVERPPGERPPGEWLERLRIDRHVPGGWLRVTMNFAAMGWAIGGAIGTAVANPEVPVVCITGDGSMLMNGQELSVAVAEQLSVIFVVLNDRALGMVKHGQRLAKAEAIGCDFPTTDFAALARALGATAYTLRSPEDLIRLDVASMCVRRGPTLLDVYIDPEEVPPMNTRIRVLTHNR